MFISGKGFAARIFVFLFLAAHLVDAQKFSGLVVDSGSREAIPFVNIGILGKGIGTVSSADGVYLLTLDAKYDNDSIRVFMIGYAPKVFKVSDFKNRFKNTNSEIVLEKLAINLDEVVVMPRKTKTKTAGHTFNNKSVILGLATGQAGCEIAALIKIKKRTTFVKQIHINLADNPFDSVLFRVNLYESVNDLPGKNLLKAPIYVTTKIKNGTVSVDLDKNPVVVKGSYFVAVQWIGASRKEVLSFCAGVGGVAYMRTTSEDVWTSNKPFGLGIHCKILYEVD